MQSGFYPGQLLGWKSPSLSSSHGAHLLLPWALRLRWLHTALALWSLSLSKMHLLDLVVCLSSLVLTRRLDVPCSVIVSTQSLSPGLDSCWATIFRADPISLTLASRFWLSNTNCGSHTKQWPSCAPTRCCHLGLSFFMSLSTSERLFLRRPFLP